MSRDQRLRSIVANPRKRAQVVVNVQTTGREEWRTRMPVHEGNKNLKVQRTVYFEDDSGYLQGSTLPAVLSEEQFESYQPPKKNCVLSIRRYVKMTEGSSIPPNAEMIESVRGEQITIYSPLLLQAVRNVVKYWPTMAYYENLGHMTLDRPYRSIGAHRREFNDLLGSLQARLIGTSVTPDDDPANEERKMTWQIIEELELLLKEVDKVQQDLIVEERARHSLDPPQATFEMLWMLFKPGDHVYIKSGGAEIAGIVRYLFWQLDDEPQGHGPETYRLVELNVWHLDHDGSRINRRECTIIIPRFDGERRVLDLPLYPERSVLDWEAEHQVRAARGNKYLGLLKDRFAHRLYDGFLSTNFENPYARESSRYYNGKVIIDPQFHAQEQGPIPSMNWEDYSDLHHGTHGNEMRKFVDLDPESEETVFSDIHQWLLPRWIVGFTLGDTLPRQWVYLDLDHVHEIEFEPSLIDTIAIDENSLKKIKMLTYRPVRTIDGLKGPQYIFSPDRILGKGKGRILLLHGLPGMGKTYAAECVAEWSRRPLIRLTCAELGLDPISLEDNLLAFFRRAERWEAIVLIDEADVFLEKRAPVTSSIEKEAIVAVFLRTLEYYSGILLLTTNRIGAFDEAIISRMTAIVHFRGLSTEHKKQIRKNCLRKLKTEGGLLLDEEAKTLYASIDNDTAHPWSGREIASVLKQAVLLAQWDQDSMRTEYQSGSDISVKASHIQSAIADIKEQERFLAEKQGGYRSRRNRIMNDME